MKNITHKRRGKGLKVAKPLTSAQKKAISKQMRAFAVKYLKKGLRIAGTENLDNAFIRMIRDDYKKFMKIASAISKGQVGPARRTARFMDTQPRDEIPSKIWNSLFPEDNP